MEVELYKYMEMSTEFSAHAPFVLIFLGTIIILLASFACCCTIKEHPYLLYSYGTILAILVVLQFGAGMSIFAYRTKLMAGFNQGLNQSMINYRSKDQEKVADFDAIQATLHCCGNRGYSDWFNLEPPLPIPPSCCIKDDCDTAEPDQIYTEGCYQKVVGFLDGNIGMVAGSAIAIAFFPLIGVVLSCCLARMTNKAKYEQMT